jgi:diguanylate cyclase (GGDEF)-like protein
LDFGFLKSFRTSLIISGPRSVPRVACVVGSLLQRPILNSPAQVLEELSELQRLRLALTSAGASVYDWTVADGNISWCDNASNVLPVSDVALVSHRDGFRKLMDPEDAAVFDNLLRGPVRGDMPFSHEYRLRSKDGTSSWIEDRGVCLSNSGRVERVVGLIRVINDRKARESRLSYLASYDDLTGHLNRARLREALAETLVLAINQNIPCAYFVAAVDGLAALNEAYGFEVADEVIVGVSRRLATVLRADDVIGRIAGNKFGLLLKGCHSDDIAMTSERLRETVRGTVIRTSAGAVSASVSLGGVVLPHNVETSQEVMLRAEEALERAKTSGRDTFSLYVASPQRAHSRRRNIALGEQVLSALAERRLRLAYQPIVATESGKPVSYECLLRMVKQDGHIASAAEFIPVAEQLGLVRLVDRRVLEMAADTLRSHPGVKLSVNVSGATVGDPDWMKLFEAIAGSCRELAERLTVELTETAALNDMDDSVRFVARLREAGAKVAIDDFGAGYTSFRNLQILAVDSVKIDGSFVRGLASNRDNQIFVRTLVDLARNFELSTVAEWVGGDDEVNILRGIGVDYLQGAFFGMPVVDPPWVQLKPPPVVELIRVESKVD